MRSMTAALVHLMAGDVPKLLDDAVELGFLHATVVPPICVSQWLFATRVGNLCNFVLPQTVDTRCLDFVLFLFL